MSISFSTKSSVSGEKLCTPTVYLILKRIVPQLYPIQTFVYPILKLRFGSPARTIRKIVFKKSISAHLFFTNTCKFIFVSTYLFFLSRHLLVCIYLATSIFFSILSSVRIIDNSYVLFFLYIAQLEK